MTTHISSQTGPDVNPRRHKQHEFKMPAPGCLAVVVFLGAAPGQGEELAAQRGWTDPVASHAHPASAEHPSPIMADVWEITLYWYLEWINQILTDALEQLDALEPPEVWMDDVAESYLAHGVPDDLSPTETLDFLAAVDEADALLAQPPETLSSSTTTSFRGLLAEMKAAAQAAD